MLSIPAAASSQGIFHRVSTTQSGAAKVPDKTTADSAADRERAAEVAQSTSALNQAKTEMASSRKAMARQTIDRLKAMIDSLTKVAGTTGAVAKQVATLAKELAAAVREYRAAGGSAADIPLSSTPPASSTPSEASENPEAVDPATEDGKETPTAKDSKETPTGAPSTPAAVEGQTETPSAESAKQKTDNDASVEEARKKEDADFVEKVRALKNKLKGILSTAHASQIGRPKDLDEIEKSVTSSFKKIDDDIQQITCPDLKLFEGSTLPDTKPMIDITA